MLNSHFSKPMIHVQDSSAAIQHNLTDQRCCCISLVLRNAGHKQGGTLKQQGTALYLQSLSLSAVAGHQPLPFSPRQSEWAMP